MVIATPRNYLNSDIWGSQVWFKSPLSCWGRQTYRASNVIRWVGQSSWCISDSETRPPNRKDVICSTVPVVRAVPHQILISLANTSLWQRGWKQSIYCMATLIDTICLFQLYGFRMKAILGDGSGPYIWLLLVQGLLELRKSEAVRTSMESLLALLNPFTGEMSSHSCARLIRYLNAK